MNKKPFVYIAGAGPGDPDLITVRALHVLKECDTVIYDSLMDSSLLLNCRTDCKKIYAGKSAGKHYMKQEEINSLIISEALEGKTVLRLKGGDPFVFGRGGEECEALKKAGIGYRIIPGVTSAMAAPMSAGIPVTHRKLSRSYTLVTGHTADGDIAESINFSALAHMGGTVAFLMGLSNIKTISAELIKNGMSANVPAAVISNGTYQNQYVLRSTLADLAEKAASDKNIVSPAIIVVGECAGLNMLSEEALPLYGTNTAICGTSDFCRKLSEKISVLGGAVQILDYVKIKPVNSNDLLHELDNIKNYSVLAFTGPNSIRLFFDTLFTSGRDIRSTAHMRFAAIGPGTGSFLKNYGIKADIVPDEFTSDSLGRILVENTSENDMILIPRALKGSNIISKILSAGGRRFKEIPLYDTVYSDSIPQPKGCGFITFASSAGVRGFFESGCKIPSDAKAVCIGKYTADTLKAYGISNLLMAQCATADGIAQAILNEVTVNNGK
ncbi:uroporphyrinogen-III C-methyltransferase [Lachnospiraceae bacterium NSJ-143]|nr:uroporphyrinogen-III C-methyltransferase [Lachnospiraceae bacterium NSJ-143]